LTKSFWSEGVVKLVLNHLHKKPGSFTVVCKIFAMFVHGCPEEMKPLVVKQCIVYSNLFKYKCMSGDADPKVLVEMDSDLDAVIKELCSPDDQNSYLSLFSAFVESFIDSSYPPDSMLVNSDVVDKTVWRMLDKDNVATTTGDGSSSRQLLLGMCIAYVAMCWRSKLNLTQFITNLRNHLSLRPEDPVFSFGAHRIEIAILLSIDSERFSDAAESLLADCFVKSDESVVPINVKDTLDKAMQFILNFTGSPYVVILQKLYILAHSPAFARLLQPYLDSIKRMGIDVGKSGEKYLTFLTSVINPPPPPPYNQEDNPPPSYNEHIQQQKQQQQQQLQHDVAVDDDDTEDDDDDTENDDDDYVDADDDEEEGIPKGLPPKDQSRFLLLLLLP